MFLGMLFFWSVTCCTLLGRPFPVDSLTLQPYHQNLKRVFLPNNAACEKKGRLARGLVKIAFFSVRSLS